ncbi:MAG: molybdopterin dinucleotide binding domain-containing protein, partial [Candidatus Bathyarchaeia archaeon]
MRAIRKGSRDWTNHLTMMSHEEIKRELTQFIPKVLVPEAILNPPISWYSHVLFLCPSECQFDKYIYPQKGFPEVHMIWNENGCWITGWNGGYKMIEAFRNPKIEFILVQHPWLENDCIFADIILPVTTPLEEEDIIGVIGPYNKQYFALVYSGKCIDPIGESKSDYEICCMIAKRLEEKYPEDFKGVYEKFTEGKTIEEWMRVIFEESGASKFISFKKWKERGYWLLPVDPEWRKKNIPLLKLFTEFPELCPLKTPSGKVEFYSERLAKHFPGDCERPPIPKWIPYGKTWQESLLHKRSKKYPFLLVSNHPRWRMHAQLDDALWLREIPTCKIKGPDGYFYEPLWINPVDAEKLEIKTGDILKVYNEWGVVLGGAYVTNRIMPGV